MIRLRQITYNHSRYRCRMSCYIFNRDIKCQCNFNYNIHYVIDWLIIFSWRPHIYRLCCGILLLHIRIVIESTNTVSMVITCSYNYNGYYRYHYQRRDHMLLMNRYICILIPAWLPMDESMFIKSYQNDIHLLSSFIRSYIFVLCLIMLC